MKGQVVLISRLAARDLRRRPVEALMVFLVIAAAATTLTVAFALSGVTNKPYQQTRLATAGPDVIAIEGGGPGSAQPMSSAQLAAAVASLTKAPGVIAHSGPYPAAYSAVRFRGHTVDVVAEGRDQAPAPVDQPKVTQGGWIRPGTVVIERGFADALGVHVGDNVRIGGRSLRVAGIAVTAAIPPYPSSLCHIACPFAAIGRSLQRGQGVPNMGLVWLTRSAVAGLAGSGAPLAYLLNLKLADPAQAPAFVAQHPGTFTWQSIQSAINALIGIEQVALGVGGWLLGLLALAGLGVLAGRRMTEQSKRVGLLKAIGATPATVAVVLLVEQLTLAVGAAAAGLLAGWLIAPLLTGTGAGLAGPPGAPSISVPAVIIIAVIALAVAAISSLVPAIRAARTSTVSALADAPRVPSRRPLVIAVSARLPVPLLLALRQLSRRPRRAVLNTASITTTVTGIVAILASHAHTPIANLTISNLKLDRFNELAAIITVMLVILAAVNTTFIGWATAADGRFSSALERALGATAGQVTAGLSMAALLPALPGAIIGIPLGIAVYHLLASGTPL
ncbi:MAG: transporter permease, partial [Actinomycetia bacterium]|nr:transporter permease [Actinomycetes bacterium]